MTWATNHTVTVTIDSVNQSAYIMPDSLYVRQQVGNDTGVASFEIWDNSGNLKPGGWDVVTIAIDGVTVFGGFVTGVDVSAIDTQTGTRYRVECKDWSILLDTVTVNTSYGPYPSGGNMVEYSDEDIVANLFSTYMSGEGFDATTNVNAQNLGVRIGFENVSLRAALNALAVRAGADWFIDGSKNLWWFNPASPGNAAWAISSDNPDYAATYPPLRGSIKRSVDTLNVCNSVVLLGGYQDTRTTESFFYYSNKTTYTIANQPIKSVVQVRANTTGAGPLPATSASSRLGFAPQDSLIEDGGDAWYLVDLATGTITVDASIIAQMSNLDVINVDYVYLTQLTTTATSAASIATYGRTIRRTFYNEELTSPEALDEYAAQILEENAFGRETISLDVAEYGLLAGKLLTVNVGEVDIGGTEDLLLEQSGDRILTEASANIITDESEVSRTFLIQQVEYRPTVTAQDTYLMICSVSAGYYRSTLIEALTRLGQAAGLGGSSGPLPAIRYPGSLGAIASDLGEVVAGRVVLTNGGTAPFDWDSHNAHTGVIAGLDDSGTIPYGSFLLLEGGTVRAKIGRLTGLSGPGTITPGGWGLWTSNGYFSGTVAASVISGITGEIGGWTIEAKKLYTSNGTIQIGSAPSQVVNSANPGVRLDQSGLYGYGTIGNTFALYTDGRPPYISSGTITGVVYEITTAAVLRTGTVNPRVQIDNSGIFAYNAAGALKFQVDAATGLLTATDGVFSGSVSASTITGGTVTGAYVTGGTVSAANGTVILSSSGIRIDKAAGTASADSANILWYSGGTTLARMFAFPATGIADNELWFVAEDSSGRKARTLVKAGSQEISLSNRDNLIAFSANGTAGTVVSSSDLYLYQDLFVVGETQMTGRLSSNQPFQTSGTIHADGVIKTNTKLEGPAINLNGAASLVSGNGVPGTALGVNGDIYFDYTAGSANFFYRKQGGSWILLVTT